MSRRPLILLVDDAPLFLELGSLFLARSGEVATAGDGVEALAFLARRQPDVMVADLDMPRMDGGELCRRIKADPERRGMRVVLVTSGDAPDQRARAVRAGADDVISKPIGRVALLQSVNRFLRGRELRGLTRVPLVAEVRIHGVPEVRHGIARNVSRGGIFVEAERTAPLSTEITLSFELPDAQPPLSPTAEVVWCRPRSSEHAAGMGMRFLALDRAAAQRLDDFVYQRAARGESPVLPAAELR